VLPLWDQEIFRVCLAISHDGISFRNEMVDTAIFALTAHGSLTPSFTSVDKLLQRGTIFVRTAGCGRRTALIEGGFPPWPAAERYRASAVNSTAFCPGPGRLRFFPAGSSPSLLQLAPLLLLEHVGRRSAALLGANVRKGQST